MDYARYLCRHICSLLRLGVGVLVLCNSGYSQVITIVEQGSKFDSSFYHVERIDDNEYWFGGEYGILRAIDSLGTVRPISYPSSGEDILCIRKHNDYIFIITADAVMYRYDRTNDTFVRKRFPAFANRCFYDMVILSDGRLVVCGGTTGIAAGEPKIPHGFIAVVSSDLSEIEIVWQSWRKFVWSLLLHNDQKISAAIFNGINTSIVESYDLRKWSKSARVRGLVHELSLHDDTIWYCGARGVRYKKFGIIGSVNDRKSRVVSRGTGCIWSLVHTGDSSYGFSYDGQMVDVDKRTKAKTGSILLSPHAIYGAVLLSDTKLLMIGRGKTAQLIDLDDR